MGEPQPGLLRQRFSRSLRLRKSEDFQRVQRRGSRRRSRHLVLIWLPSEREQPRFGLAVSKKVGNAVVRNRVKRWLREAIRRQRTGLTGMDLVLIARSGARDAGFAAIAAEVDALFEPLRTHPVVSLPGGLE